MPPTSHTPPAQPQSLGQLAQVSPPSHFLSPHTTCAAHAPPWQSWPEGQAGQPPPQAPGPQLWHVPEARQTEGLVHAQSAGQVWQVSPLAASHTLLPQLEMTTHALLLHACPAGQPHTPPQPSLVPHTLASHAGVQHAPLASSQAAGALQPQSARQVAQVSPDGASHVPSPHMA